MRSNRFIAVPRETAKRECGNHWLLTSNTKAQLVYHIEETMKLRVKDFEEFEARAIVHQRELQTMDRRVKEAEKAMTEMAEKLKEAQEQSDFRWRKYSSAADAAQALFDILVHGADRDD